MKIPVFSTAAALLLACCLSSTASANPITGSISFNGVPVFNNPVIASATAITRYDSATTAVDQQSGTYSVVPNDLPVLFSAFVFSPPTQAVTDLWSFNFGGKSYSFDTTTMSSMFNPTLNIWNFGGTGILHATGFDDTPATWNFSAGQIGQSYYFGSAAAAGTGSSVPDTGTTLVFLTLGLAAIGGFFLRYQKQRITV